jgi:uncharacterized protein
VERLLETNLLTWKQQKSRKPLLIDGARQVGKSYLVEHRFGGNHFVQVHKLDFRATPAAHELFANSLEPKAILANVELFLEQDINTETDLIFFDEIGECQRAVDSLKYFAEHRPDIFLCASGSNIGLLDSFPVGKTHTLELFPLSFEEFLMASPDQKLLQKYREMSRLRLVHDKLWSHLLDYYYVGGMPEAVKAWFEQGDNKGTNERINGVKQIHQDLIRDYERDFGKYSAMDIERVFRNVPLQLARDTDDSVRRYVFKGVLEKRKRYLELRGPIDWLEKSKLVSKCYPIDSKPVPPLRTLSKENMFKLFFFDIGLLGHLLDIDYREQRKQHMIVKGFIAENFVQNELRAKGVYPIYSWNEGNSEIEFLCKTQGGGIIPVEVKSGKRTHAKSLAVYKKKYNPDRTLKLIGATGGNNGDEKNLVWPIYYAGFLATL